MCIYTVVVESLLYSEYAIVMENVGHLDRAKTAAVRTLLEDGPERGGTDRRRPGRCPCDDCVRASIVSVGGHLSATVTAAEAEASSITGRRASYDDLPRRRPRPLSRAAAAFVRRALLPHVISGYDSIRRRRESERACTRPHAEGATERERVRRWHDRRSTRRTGFVELLRR